VFQLAEKRRVEDAPRYRWNVKSCKNARARCRGMRTQAHERERKEGYDKTDETDRRSRSSEERIIDVENEK